MLPSNEIWSRGLELTYGLLSCDAAAYRRCHHLTPFHFRKAISSPECCHVMPTTATGKPYASIQTPSPCHSMRTTSLRMCLTFETPSKTSARSSSAYGSDHQALPWASSCLRLSSTLSFLIARMQLPKRSSVAIHSCGAKPGDRPFNRLDLLKAHCERPDASSCAPASYCSQVARPTFSCWITFVTSNVGRPSRILTVRRT